MDTKFAEKYLFEYIYLKMDVYEIFRYCSYNV